MYLEIQAQLSATVQGWSGASRSLTALFYDTLVALCAVNEGALRQAF